jgi:hypothetical protein
MACRGGDGSSAHRPHWICESTPSVACSNGGFGEGGSQALLNRRRRSLLRCVGSPADDVWRRRVGSRAARRRGGEDGWGGGAASRMVSGNDGGLVAREPTIGGCGGRHGGDVDAGKEKEGRRLGRTAGKKEAEARVAAWGVDVRAER